MKKVALVCAVTVAVLLLAVGGVAYWKRLAPPTVRPDALLPGDTLVLVEAVDLLRTAQRWQKTDLNQLWEEPEVQAFLARALATHPAFQRGAQLRQDLVKLWPRQAFAAVVSMDGATPKWLAGFSFAGDAQVAEPWFADGRRAMKEAHPAGKAELILHGKTEIATYTDRDFVFAETTHAGWRLAANDLALLKATLDRLDAPKETRPPGLDADADYGKSFAALPPEAELRIFARTGVFIDRLQATLAAGDPAQATGLESLGKLRAIAAVSKIDGARFHDAVFTLGERGESREPLARAALALTDPETTGFFSTQTSALGLSGLPAAMTGALPYLGSVTAGLKAQKATLADLPEIFGPEISLIIPKRGLLGATVALGLRDPQRAASLAVALTDPKLGEDAWTASDEEGLRVYTAPAGDGLLSVAPVLTVTDRYWLLARSPASLEPLVHRDTALPQLDHTDAWRDLTGSIIAPAQSFGYLNLGALFESYYPSLRPLLALGLVGNEDLSPYLDAGKLPSAAVVSRHLGGLALSEAAVPGGSLWEARGSISAGEALLGVVAVGVWSRMAAPGPPALPGAVAPQGR